MEQAKIRGYGSKLNRTSKKFRNAPQGHRCGRPFLSLKDRIIHEGRTWAPMHNSATFRHLFTQNGPKRGNQKVKRSMRFGQLRQNELHFSFRQVLMSYLRPEVSTCGSVKSQWAMRGFWCQGLRGLRWPHLPPFSSKSRAGMRKA